MAPKITWQEAAVAVGALTAAGVTLAVARSVVRRIRLKLLIKQNSRTPATPIEEVNGGILIAETLKAHGVKFLFTLCGGHISTIMVGCDKLGIKVIDVRDEATTVFAADGISRMSDSVGVAAVTAGPGLTNTITAVKNAQQAQSPVIILAGAAPSLLRGRGSLQDIDQFACMKPHVKAFFSCNTVREIVPSLQEAFKIAREGVPGPVCLEFPLDVIYTESIVRDFFEKPFKNPKTFSQKLLGWYIMYNINNVFKGIRSSKIGLPLPFHVPAHSENQAAQVLQALRSAKKPLMLVGAQTVTSCYGDGSALAKAVAQIGVPVYLAGAARGLLGTTNDIQQRHKRREALRDADVVVLLGVSCDFRLDYGQHIPRRAKLIGVNFSKGDINRGLRAADIKILAHPGRFLIDLGELAAKKPISVDPAWKKALAERENARDEQIRTEGSKALLPSGADVNGCNPVKLFLEIDKVMSQDAVIVADGGDFVGTAAYTLRPRGPLKWLDPGPFGTLGVGGGFALAAAALFPDRQVWIVWGDGSSGYSIAEYDTFLRHGYNNVIGVIGNDGCWNQILRDQKSLLKSDVGCMLTHTDYHKVAEGWGCAGVRIEDDEQVVPKLQEALKLSGTKPVVINAILQKSEFREGSISM